MSLQIIKYSPHSIAVIGNTRPYKDLLDNLGGKFNLKVPGWIFKLDDLSKVEDSLQIEMEPVEAYELDRASYNKALSRLGLEEFRKFFEIFVNVSAETPIISVGSGVGSVEAYLEALFHVQITCVDPDPSSYQRRTTDPEHLPDYQLVESMLKDHPEFIRNNSLFLNWPAPNNSGDNYDMKAVQQLQPRYILAVVDTSGGGGGAEFLMWLKESVIKGDFFEDEEYYYVNESSIGQSEDQYYVIGQHMARQESGIGTFFFKYLLLRRDDVETPNLQLIDTQVLLDDDPNGCIVM